MFKYMNLWEHFSFKLPKHWQCPGTSTCRGQFAPALVCFPSLFPFVCRSYVLIPGLYTWYKMGNFKVMSTAKSKTGRTYNTTIPYKFHIYRRSQFLMNSWSLWECQPSNDCNFNFNFIMIVRLWKHNVYEKRHKLREQNDNIRVWIHMYKFIDCIFSLKIGIYYFTPFWNNLRLLFNLVPCLINACYYQLIQKHP